MILTIGKDGFVPLNKFKSFIDVKKVKYYSLKVKKDKTVVLTFYGKDKKKLKPKEVK